MATPNDLATKTAAAKHIGRSRAQLDKWIDAGKILEHKIQRGKRQIKMVSLAEVEKTFNERDQSKSRKDGKPAEGGDYWKWKGLTEELKAQKMELDLAVRRGELLETTAVRNQAARDGQRFKERINAALARLAPHFDVNQNRRIRKEIDRALKGR